MANYTIIDNKEDLQALIPKLLAEPVVAFDTEADSFFHYMEKLCLIQVGIPSEPEFAYLIDPLSMGGPASLMPLEPVFTSPDVRILFHAGEYDIFLLKRFCGITVNNLFDTMISAQLLGYPSVGLAALVKHYFDIVLPKDEQRSDWSRRPLTPQQLEYGATDVFYLVEMAENLERELIEADRLQWAQEDFATLTLREWPERSFDELGYLKIKGARALDPTELAILRELFFLRDGRARELDRPGFKVISPRTLLDLCTKPPKNLKSLSQMKGIGERTVQHLGDSILTAIDKGQQSPHGPIPRTKGSGRKRMDRDAEQRFTRLKTWRAGRAKELELDPGVLCPNSSLEAIAITNPKQPEDVQGIEELKGWFAREFGKELVVALQ
ncbi:MAG: ribonuclease D [Deltaproteobacteria bacterium]|nr:ribonuclease D [Deltaproteobacteria bacterium]